MVSIQLTLDNTLGAMLVGVIFAAVMNGVTYAQTWAYFNTTRSRATDHSDPYWVKVLVCVLVLLDLVHQLSISHWMYYYSVTNYANPAAFGKLPWSYYGMAFPTGIVTILVQGFYVWRVWKLSKSYILTGVIWTFSLIQLSFFLYYVARASHLSANELTSVLGPYAIIVNSLGAACDIIIASAIVWSLQNLRNSGTGGGLKRTNHLLHSIMVFSMTAGIVSSVCAILVLTMAAIYPGTNIELPFYFALPRLYTNSILATLNVREHLKERQTGRSWFTSGDFESNTRPQFRRSDMNCGQDTTIRLQDLESSTSTRKTEQSGRTSDEGCSIQVKVEQLTKLDYK